ncbi:hypothetical protein ACFL4Y_01695 [Gemmatimonadota bacterium]
MFYIVLNLHMARNISFGGYVFVLAIIYSLVIGYCLPRFSRIPITRTGVWLMLFIGTSLWPSISTISDYGLATGIYSLARYFFALPIAFAAFWLLRSESSMRDVLRIFLAIVIIGMLTIPLQYMTGPISWFAVPGERAHIVRYSSLLGSLPVAGGVVSYTLYLLYVGNIKYMYKILLSSITLICAVLTLQKAAILGIPLSVVVYVMYHRDKMVDKKTVTKILITISVLLTFGYVIQSAMSRWGPWNNSVSYAVAALSENEHVEERGGDVSIFLSIHNRVIDMPLIALKDLYRYRGIEGYLFGGGYGMVGTSLVMERDSEFVTSHNGYVDFLLIGGIVHLMSFIGLACSTRKSLRIWFKYRKWNGMNAGTPIAFLGIITIALISLVFAGGLTFQPITGCLFWTVVGTAWRLEVVQRSFCGSSGFSVVSH